MLFIFPNPWAITLLSSELFLAIVRSKDITILVKKQNQRTDDEQTQVSRGLLRSLLLELMLFVPASAILVLLIFPPLAAARFPSMFTSPNGLVAFQAGLGIISYGFPFAAFRRIVTRVALNTLKEFAELQTTDVAALDAKKVRNVQE